MGNIQQIKPPNYWDPPTGTVANDWHSAIYFNTMGQVTNKVTPDENETKYIYDKVGNIRYSQNAAQAVSGDFLVYYYDQHNRLIQTGEEKDDYNWYTTPPDIANTSYGTEAGEWKINYYYDENFVTGVANYCWAKLTKTEVNSDNDNDPEHITKYVYDKFGNMLEKRIEIDGGNPISEKLISHSYDQLGRETELVYPSGNTVLRQFDAVGRLKKVYTVQ